MEDIILIGYGGHAKSVADCIERQKRYRIIGYTELEKKKSQYLCFEKGQQKKSNAIQKHALANVF